MAAYTKAHGYQDIANSGQYEWSNGIETYKKRWGVEKIRPEK